jgi:anti-sigma factor RsiW
VTDCKDLELLVSLRAAGALDAAEAARLDAHLETCAACRAEAAADAEALALAALPPPSDEERRALADLPARTLGALRAAERRRGLGTRIVAGLAAAAAAVALVLAPAVLHKEPAAPAPEADAETVVAAWDGPDLDALWEDAQVLDLEASALPGGDDADAAWAAGDF